MHLTNMIPTPSRGWRGSGGAASSKLLICYLSFKELCKAKSDFLRPVSYKKLLNSVNDF